MKKLMRSSFNEIQHWIYRNARQIELAAWQYEFENGSKDAIISALAFYQNEDGGFGNALEPDSWNPNSSPYTTLNAIRKLNEINFTDINHPMMQGILKFLDSGMHRSDNGWLFSIPSNDGYPHAPWWTYDSEANEYESIGVSAGIACFILKFADKDSDLYERAFAVIDKLIARLYTPGNYGEMGLSGYCALKDIIQQLGLIDKYDIEFLSRTLKKLVNDAIERDISKWAYYGKIPSSFISSPDSEFYKDNEEIMQKELDYIIETRPKNGVWGITFSWFENKEKYANEFAVSENWWKADSAISKLKLLRSFGRVQ